MSEQHEETGQERFARLLRLGMSAKELTAAQMEPLCGSSDRSIEKWLREGTVPQLAKRAGIERALGWQPGIVTEMLEEDVFRTKAWTLDDVRVPDPAQQPVARASQLTDDELLTEMTRRFKTYAEVAGRVDDPRQLRQSPAQARFSDFDLAASNDPAEKKTRRPKN